MADLNVIKPEKVQRMINKFCCTIGMLPTSYKASLTYEEQILAIGHYLETVVYPAINQNAEALEELQGLFIALKDYVDNYFDNLDVQDEIDHKLDELIESGELQEIVEEYFTEINEKFDNINYLNVKDYGLKGDGTTDDTEALKTLILMNKPLYFPEGTYIISETITINANVNWIGQGNKTIINSRGLSELHPDYVNPVIDFSASNNIRLKGFCSTNSTFKIYATSTEEKSFRELMKNKYIFVENVTNDISNNSLEGKTNWQGFFLNIPAPDNYERDFHNGKYPRYGIQIFNNGGYNAIDIDNRIYDENGDYETVLDNSALGIVDGVKGSAPALFIDMHAERNAINIKNRTETSSANSVSNPDSVFQVGYNGHLAIGCSVYSEEGATGTGTIKLKDDSPAVRFYDTNYPQNIAVIRNQNNQLQFVENGILRSYYENNGQHTYVAPLKIKPMAESKGGLILESTYANGSDYHIFANDQGLIKINRTSVDVEQSTESGYTIQYNFSGNTASRPTSKLTNNWQTIGLMYFDTTLNKPIWWNGTNWVDATGTTV